MNLSPQLLKYVGAYAAYVAFLHSVDGPWRHWKEGRQEGDALDLWTATHVAWGALGAHMGLTPTQVLVLGTINELAEHVIRTKRPDLLWGSPESPGNVAMDIIATMAGWKLGELLSG